jgi:preprotein translocase subunit SecE
VAGPRVETEDVNVKSAMLERARDTTSGVKGLVGWWGRTRTFLSQVKNEMERVTWPSWKEVQATTFVVILTSLFFGLYLFGIDQVLNTVAAFIFRTFGSS